MTDGGITDRLYARLAKIGKQRQSDIMIGFIRSQLTCRKESSRIGEQQILIFNLRVRVASGEDIVEYISLNIPTLNNLRTNARGLRRLPEASFPPAHKRKKKGHCRLKVSACFVYTHSSS